MRIKAESLVLDEQVRPVAETGLTSQEIGLTAEGGENCTSAMVWEQPFSGYELENPYHHLREFEQMCSCLSIAGMAQETLRWKLFPFSLAEKAKQWYTHNVGKVNGEWEELQNRFCLAFFPISLNASLRKEILDFRQDEKETLGAAWARFTQLTHAGPDLSIPDHVLLQHFWLGLNNEATLQLDITTGGSFAYKL